MSVLNGSSRPIQNRPSPMKRITRGKTRSLLPPRKTAPPKRLQPLPARSELSLPTPTMRLTLMPTMSQRQKRPRLLPRLLPRRLPRLPPRLLPRLLPKHLLPRPQKQLRAPRPREKLPSRMSPNPSLSPRRQRKRRLSQTDNSLRRRALPFLSTSIALSSITLSSSIQTQE